MEIGKSSKSVNEHSLDDETPSTSRGSNKKAKQREPSGEAGKVECKYYVNINNASGVIIGDDGHVTIGQSSSEQKQDAYGDLDVRIREQAKIDCGNILAPVDLERPIVPVTLKIASKPDQVSSELDEEGHFHRRQDFVKFYQQPLGNFNETEMFQHPKQKAQEEAKKFKTDADRKDYVARNGNIIGVVGQPGVGKTTSVKKWVRKVLNGKLLANVTFLFLIFVRNIDFSQKMTLFDLLVSTVLTDWEHSPENDRAWLGKILKDRNVLIALDGFDEANVEDLNKRSLKVNIYDKADPLDLLLNLISGNLLPFARIIVTSRPKQLFHLDPDHKPKFVVQILGLNEQRQNELGRQICSGSYEQIREILLNNADVFAYCYIPVNFILTVFFLMNRKSDNDFVCMTLVLSFACERYSCSDQLKDKTCNLDQLSKLAWKGFKKMQITFGEADLREAKVDAHTIHSFMNTSVVESTNIKMTIMEGHERSYFSHLIWQEYFAALYLMLFASDKEFGKSLEHLFDDRWQVITRFLFGLCNHEAYAKVKCVIPTDCTSTCSRDQWKKKKAKLLKVATTYLAKQYGWWPFKGNVSNEEKWQKLLYLCSCVHEANDKDMTGAVAARFPDSITISGTILPSDISSFFHVVRAARTLPILEVNSYCFFFGDSLARLWKEVATSGMKIRSFHLWHQMIVDDDLSNIVESLQHVEELILISCGVTRSLIGALAKRWEQTKPQIRDFRPGNSPRDFSRYISDKHLYHIGDEGLSCLIGCLQFVRKLDLSTSDISNIGVKMLAEKLLKAGHKFEWLILNYNYRIDDVGARLLIPYLHLIETLGLVRCAVTEAVKKEIRSELERLGLPEDRVHFDLEEDRVHFDLESGLLVGQTSASVGPGGVTLSAGRCQVVIPEGALEEQVIITLTARYYGNDDTGRITPVLQCEPHGLEFKKSVDIILPTCFFPDEGESVTAMARQSKNGIDWETIKTFDHQMDRSFSFSTECFSFFDVIAKKLGWLIEKCFTCEVQKTKSIDCNKLYVTCRIDDDIQGCKNNEDSPINLDQTFLVRPNDEYIRVSLSNNSMDIDPLESRCEDVRNRRWKSTFHLKKKTTSLLDEKVEIELSTANGPVFKNQLFTSSDHLFTEQYSEKVKPSSKTGDTGPKFEVNVHDSSHLTIGDNATISVTDKTLHGPTSNMTLGTKTAVAATDETLRGESSNVTPEQLHKSNNQRRMDLTHCETLSSQQSSSSAVENNSTTRGVSDIAESENRDDSDS